MPRCAFILFNLVDVDPLIIENKLGNTVCLSSHVDCVRANKTVLVEVDIQTEVKMGSQKLIAVSVAVWVPFALCWLGTDFT